MRDPLAIAADGYLSKYKKTLNIATEGYLSVYAIVVLGVGGGGYGHYIASKDMSLIRRREMLKKEEEEILLVIELFMLTWDH